MMSIIAITIFSYIEYIIYEKKKLTKHMNVLYDTRIKLKRKFFIVFID